MLEAGRPTQSGRNHYALIALVMVIVTMALPTGSAVGSAVPPQAIHQADDPALTIHAAPFSINDIIPSAFWGVNALASAPLKVPQQGQLSATTADYLIYPGGDQGERYNYSTNRIASNSGTFTAPAGSIKGFISTCQAINCQSILQLPMEINQSYTAAYYVRFVERSLGFVPTYWELGNEPAGWAHYNKAWSTWTIPDAVNTTPVAFGQEVLRYVTAIRAVDPNAQIVALGGTGQGNVNDAPWIKQVVKYSGQNLSAVSVHSYVDGTGPGSPSLVGFYRGLNVSASAYAMPNLVKLDRAAILAGCGSCTTVQLFITEDGASNATGGYAANYLPTFNNSVFMAGQLAQALIFNVSNLDYYALNSSYPGAWFVSSTTPSPIYYLYSILLPKLGNIVWNTSVSSVARDVYAVVTANASGGRQLLLANANQTQSLTLTMSGFPTTGSGTIYTWNSSSAQPKTRTWSSTLPTQTVPANSILLITQIPSSPVGISQPAARSKAVFQWDLATSSYVMYGGINDTTGQVYNDTWIYQAGFWLNITGTLATQPPKLYSAYSCYDPSQNGVYIWGGLKTPSGQPFNYTWEFTGTSWLNVSGSAGTSPTANYDGQLVWDPGLIACLWFGGDLGASAQTWELKAGVWHKLNPSTTPPIRGGEAMAYDSGTSAVIMFGGRVFNGNRLLNDTWSFGPNNWVFVNLSNVPSPRNGSIMAANPYLSTGLGPIILYGGWNGAQSLSDTWTFTNVWTNVTSRYVQYPSQRMFQQAAANASGVTVWSGNTANSLPAKDIPDSWFFYLGAWALAAPPSALPPTGLTTNSVTAINLILNWFLPSGQTNIAVRVSQGLGGCGSLSLLATLGVVTTYLVTNLTSSTTYGFVVQVETQNFIGARIWSAYSNCAIATTPSATPSAPTNLRVTNMTGSSLLLRWSNPSTGGLVNNTIWYGLVCGHWTTTSTAGANTVFNLTGLSASTQYCLSVSVWNGSGNSQLSGSIYGITASSGGGGGGGSGGGGTGGGSTNTPPATNNTTAPSAFQKFLQEIVPTSIDYAFVGLAVILLGALSYRQTGSGFAFIYVMMGGLIFLYALIGIS